MQPIPKKEEFERAHRELDVPCRMVVAAPPSHWFFFAHLISGTIAGDGWAPQHEKLIKEFLDAIQDQLKEISPYAAELMRRDEDAE